RLFTIFLTAPLQAFCLLLGHSGSDIDMDLFSKAEKLLSSSLNAWGSALATSNTLNPVWAQTLSDPFLRRILLRFLFCQAVLTLYAPTFNKKEFHPMCMPPLPVSVLPTTTNSQMSRKHVHGKGISGIDVHVAGIDGNSRTYKYGRTSVQTVQ
ncbi:hypothetical protein CMV_027103, partial [Castanea mollissima]